MSIVRIKVLVFSVVFAFSSLSQAKGDLFKGLNYPELQVSPLASERLALENGLQKDKQWTNNVMFQASGLATLLAGVTSSADTGKQADFDDARAVSTMVGASWLIGMTAMSYFYKPYASGLERVKGLPAKNKQQKLVRERMAEERLMAPSKLVKTLKWLAFLTNLGAAINLAENVDNDSRGWVAIAGGAAFLPLLFKHNYQHAADQHRIYKKKIYGPVFGTGLLQTPDRKKTILGLQASLNF